MMCSQILPSCETFEYEYFEYLEYGEYGECRDDESIESRENVTRNATMYARKRNGGKGSRASCPGGSLDDCIAACPTQVRVYKACVANCGRKCNKK